MKANQRRRLKKEKTPNNNIKTSKTKCKRSIKQRKKQTKVSPGRKKKEKAVPQIDRVDDVRKLIQIVHVGNRSRFHCKMCGKICYQHSDIKMHVKIHDGTNPFHCAKCDKYFLRRYFFSLHMAKHGGNPVPVKGCDSKKKQCKLCDQSFISISQLSEHCLDAHPDSYIKENQCNVCLKVFISRQKLLVHRVVHSVVVPWKCSGCKAQFKQRKALQKHQVEKNCGKPEDLESGSVTKVPRPPKSSKNSEGK